MENKHSGKRSIAERTANFLQEKGVYLVLMACIAIVGIAVAAAYLPGEEGAEEDSRAVTHSEDERLDEAAPAKTALPAITPAPTAQPAAQPWRQEEAAEVPQAADAGEEAEQETEPEPAGQPDNTPTPAREKADPPVKGGVQWEFAADELVYSRTLKQWMTHSGVDISASRGEEVHAILDGTVEEVYEDDSLGVTVRISHRDGLETVYANLRSDTVVKEGDRVSAGDVIGYVGDTAISECADGAHLHFEVYRDGSAEDPLDHIIIVE